jgi:hypothetical protein
MEFQNRHSGDAIFYKFNETKLIDSISYNQTLLNSTGVTSTIQPYFQAKFRPMQSATLIAGIHATYLELNNTYSNRTPLFVSAMARQRTYDFGSIWLA